MNRDRYELPDFLEFGILDFYDMETTEVTLYVHGRDGNMYVFKDLVTDPVISKGWVTLAYRQFGQEISMLFPASNFAYATYYTTEKTSG